MASYSLVFGQEMNSKKLADIALDRSKAYTMQYKHAEDEAKKRGARKLLKLNNGSSILVGIENDRLLYTKEFNIEAANTTKTNTLKVGGNLGLSLDGLNEVVGVWEVFQPRISHQELEGRVEQKDAGNTINTHYYYWCRCQFICGGYGTQS